jgi:hypothetical protein
MGQQFNELSAAHRDFIERQRVFFAATAAKSGRVNVSPKGSDSLKVLGPNEVLWMNLTGSGNESAAHLADTNRMTIMWCAFEGPPRILRIYGTARTIHRRDEGWAFCEEEIPAELGSRQYFKVQIDMVQTSCGYNVPLFEYSSDRDVLRNWAQKKGADGISDYWEEKNQTSIDGLPTGVLS